MITDTRQALKTQMLSSCYKKRLRGKRVKIPMKCFNSKTMNAFLSTTHPITDHSLPALVPNFHLADHPPVHLHPAVSPTGKIFSNSQQIHFNLVLGMMEGESQLMSSNRATIILCSLLGHKVLAQTTPDDSLLCNNRPPSTSTINSSKRYKDKTHFFQTPAPPTRFRSRRNPLRCTNPCLRSSISSIRTLIDTRIITG